MSLAGGGGTPRDVYKRQPEHIAALRGALDGAAITPPAPLHTDLLPAATEKLPALLPADAAHGPVLDVTCLLYTSRCV